MIHHGLTDSLGQNQDSYFIPYDEFFNEKTGYLYLIADGVGGSRAGNIASKLVINWIIKDFKNAFPIAKPEQFFIKEIQEISYKLYNFGEQHEHLKTLKTTLTLLYIKDNLAYVFNVGDSRLYHLNGKFQQVTKDHSLVWKMYEKNMISKDEILLQPNKNIITQAIGMNMKLNIDYHSFELQQNDILFLCTDGISDFIKDENLQKFFFVSSDYEFVLNEILKRARQNGSFDDATMILLKL